MRGMPHTNQKLRAQDSPMATDSGKSQKLQAHLTRGELVQQ